MNAAIILLLVYLVSGAVNWLMVHRRYRKSKLTPDIADVLFTIGPFYNTAGAVYGLVEVVISLEFWDRVAEGRWISRFFGVRR